MATNRLHQDYTVAWLCALPCEMAAAEAMLDEKHPDLPIATEDDNTYILGRVYSHNVVIACCRSGVYGTTSASACAIQLQATFTSIRFFLLVGIGGGAPTSKVDIRLGDVVVSKPTRDFGGVVQYDYGKTINGGRFERTGVLNKPRSVLLTALARLEAAHKAAPSKIPAILAEMVERNPGMGRFTYKCKDRDILFDSEYDHCDENDTCDGCDTQRAVVRSDRIDYEPVVHYGLIASGNQVIKHAQTRDRLARELGILCFEMEAAGVMDHFQCLVVRGICDYSDSHKNKQWQEYAAATAAAFAKELLSVVHAVQILDAPLAQSDASHYRGIMRGRGERTTTDMTVHGRDAGDIAKLVSWISDYDEKKVHRRLLQKRLVGTTQWFFDHPDFKAWFNDRTISTLWCSGKIGSGKAMIATTAVEVTMYRSAENRSPTAFFYCESDLPRTLVDTYILSSLIKQLCEFLHLAVKPFPTVITSELRRFFGPDRMQPDWMDLANIFTLLFDLVPDSVYIVDGLDAMDQKYSKSLLELFYSLFRRTRSSNGPRLLIFSRDQVSGYMNLSTFVPGICRISTSTNVQGDIERYIDTSITDKSLYRRLTDNLSLLEQVKQTLLDKSSEMFLWVYLQLEILWDTCHTDAEIRASLTTLPKGLEEVYRRCIDRITRRHSFAPKVLKWVSFAIRPLHIDELREAVSFGLEDTKWTDERMPQKDVLIGCCANLVILDTVDNCARFAHSSVKQYLERHLAGEHPSNRDLEYPDAKRGNLECGELCVAYLSFSDFSLQLTKKSTEKAELAVPSPALLAHQALSRHPRTSSLFSRFWTRNRKTPLSLNITRGPPPPDPKRYKFLNYAVTYWALHTKDLSPSVAWKKFESLATRFNEVWDFHPWTSGGRSYDSRLHGLFGWAVKEQHEPLLTIALATGEALLRIRDLPLIGESLPALHVASKLGYTRITQILLSFCTVNLPDVQGYTALHYAANGGHIEICRVLLEMDEVDVEPMSKSKFTPLSLAATHGHDEIVALMLQRRAYAHLEYDYFRSSPLLEAARNGHHKVVSVCIDDGANLECKDINDRTALSWAAGNGHEAVMELLADHGAEIDTKDDQDIRPLAWAAINGHGAAVSLLLARGAYINIEDIYGNTPLSHAAALGHAEVVKLLLDMGAETPIQDFQISTAEARAIENDRKTVMKLFAKRRVP